MNVFERKEAKYLITKEQYKNLLSKLNVFLEQDEYFEYTNCNIYYDTDNYDLLRKSIDKPFYKEKIRLRSYGTPNSNDKVFLEIKKKCGGIVYKRRINNSLNNIYSFLSNPNIKLEDSSNNDEIQTFLKRYFIKPKIYVSYDRKSYFWNTDKNIRITFDTNICYRFNKLSLEKGTGGKQLFNENTILMEVKSLNNLPLEFCSALSELKIFPISFSKVGEIYKQNFTKEEVFRK